MLAVLSVVLFVAVVSRFDYSSSSLVKREFGIVFRFPRFERLCIYNIAADDNITGFVDLSPLHAYVFLISIECCDSWIN